MNEVRRENGLQELDYRSAPDGSSAELSDQKFTWHHTKEECEAVAASGYPYGFGSNLTVFTGAAIADIAQRAVDNWEKSPGHFQTMTDPDATSLGVGVTKDNGVTYCYLFLGKPNTNNPYG
ncbi:MAG: CAP domain-containing protein [Oscillospiraceae bacterium]